MGFGDQDSALPLREESRATETASLLTVPRRWRRVGPSRRGADGVLGQMGRGDGVGTGRSLVRLLLLRQSQSAPRSRASLLLPFLLVLFFSIIKMRYNRVDQLSRTFKICFTPGRVCVTDGNLDVQQHVC